MRRLAKPTLHIALYSSFVFLNMTAFAQTDSDISYVKMDVEKADKSVHITWEVANETGGDSFVIEKSFEEEIWIHKGSETSAGDHVFYKTYEKSMTNYPEDAVEKFRLLRIDKNGEATILDTATIYHAPLSNPKIMDVQGKLGKEVTLTYTCLAQRNVRITAINIDGDLLYNKSMLAIKGDNSINIKTKKFKPGRYQVVVRDEMENKITKGLRVH